MPWWNTKTSPFGVQRYNIFFNQHHEYCFFCSPIHLIIVFYEMSWNALFMRSNKAFISNYQYLEEQNKLFCSLRWRFLLPKVTFFWEQNKLFCSAYSWFLDDKKAEKGEERKEFEPTFIVGSVSQHRLEGQNLQPCGGLRAFETRGHARDRSQAGPVGTSIRI